MCPQDHAPLRGPAPRRALAPPLPTVPPASRARGEHQEAARQAADLCEMSDHDRNQGRYTKEIFSITRKKKIKNVEILGKTESRRPTAATGQVTDTPSRRARPCTPWEGGGSVTVQRGKGLPPPSAPPIGTGLRRKLDQQLPEAALSPASAQRGRGSSPSVAPARELSPWVPESNVTPRPRSHENRVDSDLQTAG